MTPYCRHSTGLEDTDYKWTYLNDGAVSFRMSFGQRLVNDLREEHGDLRLCGTGGDATYVESPGVSGLLHRSTSSVHNLQYDEKS